MFEVWKEYNVQKEGARRRVLWIVAAAVQPEKGITTSTILPASSRLSADDDDADDMIRKCGL